MLNNSKSMEETNSILEREGLPSYNDSFVITFRVKKKHFFTVEFGDVKAHGQQPYFSTSGGILNYIRSDYNRCGQCQNDVLSTNTTLYTFFRKWDVLHIKSLTMQQLNELKSDIEVLKAKYPYIESDSFDDIVAFDREMSK